MRLLRICYDVAGSDVACQDFVSSTTTGAFIVAAISGQSCSVVTCTVKRIYDLTQGNKCNGSCDLIQTTVANRYVFVTNCGDGFVCFQATAATQVYANLATGGSGFTVATAQPAIFTTYAQNVSASYSSSASGVYCNAGLYFGSTFSDAFLIYAGGSVVSASAAHGSFHAAAAILNGSSTTINVDGSVSSPGSPGTNACSSTVGPQMFGGNSSYYWRNSGFFSTGVTTTLRDNLESTIASHY
jgi:hypothetical protein